jgi:alkanesulfonate monooxygenase SsuD/methylene tetrahydromethanopterin reductase-like flavin-dependent oxidoreductase (luciferase family)
VAITSSEIAMKLGLQIPSFTWPGGTEAIGPTLARVAKQADDVGFDSIWVMDHFFQIRSVGRVEEPMLEGWTTLGYLAAATKRARLGLMVGGVHYRLPGLWIKAATTLDVLSGGRAWLGIGAAWNQQESESLGFPFPALGERFEMLEETLQIAQQMWSLRNCLRRSPLPRDAAAEFAAVDFAAPATDHDRWWRRAKDAPARCRICRRDERLRRPERDPSQVRGPPGALRSSRPRPR